MIIYINYKYSLVKMEDEDMLWEFIGIFEKPQIGIGWLEKVDYPLAIFKKKKSNFLKTIIKYI